MGLVVPKFVDLLNLGEDRDMVVVTMVKLVKDWVQETTPVMAVARWAEIAEAFAALKGKSAVGRYVVHQTIIV